MNWYLTICCDTNKQNSRSIKIVFLHHHNYRREIKTLLFGEEFEDTKGVIRIRKSKKNRQRNGQQKKYKRINNDLQNIHIKLKIE